MWKLVFLVILVLVGCSAPSKVGVTDAQSRIHDLIWNGPGIEVGTSRVETLALLGETTKTEQTFVENSYYEFKDEITTYYYPGLEILYFKHNHPESGWDGLVRIEVSKNYFKLKYGIQIGMPAQEIFRNYGAPQYPPFKDEKSGEESFVYMSEESSNGQIIFVVGNEKLNKFIWSNMPD